MTQKYMRSLSLDSSYDHFEYTIICGQGEMEKEREREIDR